MEEMIRKAIEEALGSVNAGGVDFTVERPASLTHGDYATNVAMVAAKAVGKNPRTLAGELVGGIQSALGESASRVEVAGPGFINITLSRGAVSAQLALADAQGADYARGTALSGNTISIEYSNPNAFKEMHIGHLMGSIIGESLSRLIENEGAHVVRDTFGGDVGPNVAKALWALQKEGVTDPESAAQIGAAYAAGSQAYESEPQAKNEIDALNKAIYAGTDHALMELWRKGRDVSMEAFGRLWKIFGTSFDYTLFDSDVAESGMRIVRDGLARDVFKKSEGAIIYDGEAKGVHTMVFITSHDTPTYEAKDLGLAFMREEKIPNDRIIVVTGTEQTGRFKTVLAVLSEIAPQVAAKTEHVATGFLKLASGKMSSREGNVLTAETVLGEVMARAGEKNADPLIAEQVAVGALKYMVLRQAPGSDIIFDPEKSLSLEGDSGPYLQYALVRAKSVLAKAGSEAGASPEAPPEPYPIERTLVHYPDVVHRAAQALSPNLLVTYLTELSGQWNAFYGQEKILGGEYEAHKLMLARAFVQTMTGGLHLLGIPSPERL